MKPEFLQARYYTFISTCSMIAGTMPARLCRLPKQEPSSDDNRHKIDN